MVSLSNHCFVTGSGHLWENGVSAAVSRDSHAALEKRIGDFLLIRLQVVEGDPDRMFRRDCNPDDPVHAIEDRPYPRKRPSCGAAGNGQLERLLSRRERPGKSKGPHETGQEAEDCFPLHQVTPVKRVQKPVTPRFPLAVRFFLKRKEGECPVEIALLSDGGPR